MKLLSFQFDFKFSKLVLIICSLISTFAIIIFLFYYLVNGISNKFGISCFLVIYLIISNIFSYNISRSKNIVYDSKTLIIQINRNIFEEVPIRRVIKIKRTFFYFYTLYYWGPCNISKKVIFFISPNPSFSKPKQVEEVLTYAKE